MGNASISQRRVKGQVKAAYAIASGRKAMDIKTYTLQMDHQQARNQLQRLEHAWVWGKRNFNNAIYNCIVGGIILPTGLLALIGFLVQHNQFGIVMAATCLSFGNLTFINGVGSN
jgi:hypothetical protein